MEGSWVSATGGRWGPWPTLDFHTWCW